MTSRYAQLSQVELASLLPELLLVGFMVDRAGLPWCMKDFGREEMEQIAIDEWVAASPIYAKRIQKALNFEGDDVVTIFKAMQFDVGAPPQFMDFRYVIHDPYHGEFYLNHCGSLIDLEPLGADFITGMCHTIEDPTFDATAIATNPRAQMRPIHRPPRVPTDQHPHCAWTVSIEDHHPAVPEPPGLDEMRRTRLANLELDAIHPSEDGVTDYSGPLVSDVDFTKFSHSTLVRLADEVCIQMHLLSLGLARALEARTDTTAGNSIRVSQMIGFGAAAAERLLAVLKLPPNADGAKRILELHPMFNPAAYVSAEWEGDRLVFTRSQAHDDEAWVSLLGRDEVRPLQAIVQAVDPTLDVDVVEVSDGWAVAVTEGHDAAPETKEAAVTKMGDIATWQFEKRTSLPLTVV
jgi:hypothetical protein